MLKNSAGTCGRVAQLRAGILYGLLLLVISACGGSGQDPAEVLRSVDELERKAEFESAIVVLKSLLQEHPNEAPARLRLGRLHLKLIDGAAAEKELRQAAALGLPGAEVGPQLVHALMLQFEIDKAVALAETLVEQQPNAEILALLGDLRILQNDPVSAVALYARALEADPDNVRALLGDASLAQSRREYDQAAAGASRAVTLAPNDAMAHRALGNIEFERGKLDAALAAYRESARLNPVRLVMQIDQIRALLALEKIDEAETVIARLKNKFGDSPLLSFYAGVARYQVNDVGAAIDRFREVLSVLPQHARSQFFLGVLNYRQGQYAQAVEMLSLFLRQVPNYVPARKLLAASQINLGKPNEALATLDAIRPDAVDADVETLRAGALASRGDIERGMEAIQRSVEMAPDDVAKRVALAISRIVSDNGVDTQDLISPDAELGDLSLSEQMVAVYARLQQKQWQEALSLSLALEAEHADNALIPNASAMAYIGLDQPDKARAALKRSLALDPDSTGTLRNLVLFEFRQGDFAAAAAANERLLLQDSVNVFAHTMAGNLARQARQVDAAIAHYERARELDGAALDARLRLALIYFERGQYDKALASADEVAQRNPDIIDALLLVGQSLLKLGQPDDARIAADRALSLYPDEPAVQSLAANVALQQGEYQRAEDLISAALETQPGNPQAIALRIGAAIGQGDFKAAAADLRILEADPASAARAAEARGDIQIAEGDARAAAASYATAAAATDSGALAIKRHRALRTAGDIDAAVGAMSEYLQNNPAFTAGYLELAATQIGAGANDAAIEIYEKFLDLEPDNAIVLNNLANLKFARGDKDALATAKRAFELAPNNNYVLDTYGWLLVQVGDVEQGLKNLETAASGLERNGEVAYHLAVALSRSKSRKKAIAELERALQLEPFESQAKARDLLAALRN